MKIKKEQILSLIMDLGVALADHNHVWSNDLRRRFERITSFLSDDSNE